MTEILDIISQNTQSTVVAEYVREEREKETGYQSESDLENELIAQLQRQGYEYIPIHNEKELIKNLRRQLEKLNDITFADSEWERFFKIEIAKESNGIKEKAFTIQRDYKKSFVRDDGTQLNISLIDKKDVHHNITQVINQYAVDSGTQKNRYDVTILVNGLPLVHIELKRRGLIMLCLSLCRYSLSAMEPQQSITATLLATTTSRNRIARLRQEDKEPATAMNLLHIGVMPRTNC